MQRTRTFILHSASYAKLMIRASGMDVQYGRYYAEFIRERDQVECLVTYSRLVEY